MLSSGLHTHVCIHVYTSTQWHKYVLYTLVYSDTTLYIQHTNTHRDTYTERWRTFFSSKSPKFCIRFHLATDYQNMLSFTNQMILNFKTQLPLQVSDMISYLKYTILELWGMNKPCNLSNTLAHSRHLADSCSSSFKIPSFRFMFLCSTQKRPHKKD